MKLHDFSIVILIVIVFSAAIIGITSSHYLGEDNVVEEVAEEIINKEIGLSIDLTPSSKEK